MASDNAAYGAIAGKSASAGGGRAPFLRALFAGTDPSIGESHLPSPSDAFAFCRAGSNFWVRGRR